MSCGYSEKDIQYKIHDYSTYKRIKKLLLRIIDKLSRLLRFRNIDRNKYIPHPLLNWTLNPRYNNRDREIHTSNGFRNCYERRNNIYCIGGSATYCHYIEDSSKTWPYLIGKKTGRGVVNAGVSGYTFLQSLVKFIMWHKYFNTDLVIVYDGKNDIVPLLTGYCKPDYTPGMRVFKPSHKPIYDVVYGERNFQSLQNIIFSENALFGYYDTLKTICDKKGIRVIFIPQITTSKPYQLYLNKLKNHLRQYDAIEFNDYSMLSDGTHFSEEGCERFAEFVSKLI